MVDIKRGVLLIAFLVMTGVATTASVADEKLEGKVVEAKLTLCHPRPTGGGCEGTLTVETTAHGAAQRVTIKVIEDTIIRKGQDYLLLPQTQGNSVVVTYVTQTGQKVAKSIDVGGSAQ